MFAIVFIIFYTKYLNYSLQCYVLVLRSCKRALEKDRKAFLMFRQKIESEIQNLQGRSFNSVGSEGRFVSIKKAKVILTHFFPSRGKNSFEQAILSDLERIEDQYGRMKIELNGQKSGVEVNIFCHLNCLMHFLTSGHPETVSR